MANRSPFSSGRTQTDPADTRLLMGIAGSARSRSWGRPVKAVVKKLGDEELVIAQGQENNERQDLSYIEKARFAHRLGKRGLVAIRS